MGSKKTSRKKGRPNKTQSILSEERILSASESLLKSEKISGFSMRKLAKVLGVDSMAIYHYYPDKQNLIFSLLNKRFEVYTTKMQKKLKRNWELESLCISYLRFYQNSKELIHFLALVESEFFEIKGFSVLLFQTEEFEKLDKQLKIISRNLIVDFIHGYALSGKKNYKKKEFLEELGIILLGIQAKIWNK